MNTIKLKIEIFGTQFKLLNFFFCFVIASFFYFPFHLNAQTFPAGFSQVSVATIFYPTSMAFAPDGRIFCTEKAGKVKIVKNGNVLATPFLQVSVNQLNERGLSSVALDPDFANNHYVYIYYTTSSSPIHNRLSRFTANGDVALAGSEVQILNFETSVNSIHNAGGMSFGADGKLYLAVGNDNVNSYSQDLNNYKGKVLRINTDGSVPSGNPFTGSESAKRIWAYGFRNPWTIDIQPGTNKLFVNDVGEGTWEEINNATTGGKNFGWPGAEGMSSNSAYTNPTYTYRHGASGTDFGCSITGGAFFNPVSTNYPGSYTGKYFFIDYCNHWINYLDLSSGVQKFNFATNLAGALNYIKVGTDGNLYYFSISQNTLYKIIYSSNNAPVITDQPDNLTVSEGQQAIFNVSVSGTNPLGYQWKKNGINIAGANSSSYTINNVQPSHAGQYTVFVSNNFGNVTSNPAILAVTAFNSKPAATIISPLGATFYRDGDTINFSGNGTDQEDGILPATAFNWIVEFHHDIHIHPGPFISEGIKNGSFIASFGSEVAANVFFRLILYVTDSQGSKDTAFVDIYPVTSSLNLTSQPSGLQLFLEGFPHTTPYSVLSISGMTRTLGVNSPQVLNGFNYEFDHWTHGGNASQNIVITDNDQTFTAVFNATGIAECAASGNITRDYWSNVLGTTVSTVPVNTTPTGSSLLTIFEGPSQAGYNYASRIRGYICPPITGNYIFWIASDDNSELWLSTNDQPANKVKIASVPGYTASRAWTKYPAQQSSPQPLIAGVKYYIEALHKEGSQGDNLAVGWQLPNGIFERPIPGTRLSPYITPGNNSPVVLITSPGNNASYASPANITINATATSDGGSITKVEFYQGSVKIGEDLTSPYSFTWMNVTNGNYALKAIATNNNSQTVTSQIVNITVSNENTTCTALGNITRDYWSNVLGTTVSTVPANTTPTGSGLLTIFEGPSQSGDNYASRISGYICPPITGNYIFWIASDDNSELWLSTNDQPANKVKIASVPGYTASRAWTKYPAQQSSPRALIAGVKYYIEALHKEGSQGDNLAVGWQLPNGIFERPIPGTRLSPYITPGNNSPVVLITSPGNNASYASPANITINATATSDGGSITKVEFYQGTVKIGEDLTAPYSFTWMNVANGNYALKAIATNNTNQTSTSQIVNIMVTTCSTPIITAAGPTTVCSGSVTLLSNTGSGYIYQWKKDGVNISGATTSSYTATTSGQYQIKLIQGSCISWSAPTLVKIQSGLRASITPGGSTTFCSGGNVKLFANTCTGYTYQWKKDGSYIPGATGATFIAEISGNYQLQVTQAGANAWSALVTVSVMECRKSETNQNEEINETLINPLSTDSSGLMQMNVYPNPNTGLFTIELNMALINEENVQMRIVNIMGQEVYNKEFSVKDLVITEVIELDKSLLSGVYTLQVLIGNKMETTSIVLSR